MANDYNSKSIIQYTEALISNVKRNTHVCNICKITKINGDGTYNCNDINNDEQLVVCNAVASLRSGDDALQENDIVVVLYTDTDYRTNLRRIAGGKPTQNIKPLTYHSIDFGVIISKM